MDETRTDGVGGGARLRIHEGGHGTFGTFLDINRIGLATLIAKEIRRFLKVPMQTVLAPVVTTLVFLAVFSLALGRTREVAGGIPFLEFLAPGLIMMAIIQNAFANTSSSLVIAKVQGNIVDILMPPLSPGELIFGMLVGGIVRGVMVGVAVWIAMLAFVPALPQAPLVVLFHALAASLSLSLLGLIVGLWAEKFDQMSAVTNFVITPLSFLSGTFYSITQLPEAMRVLAHLNPFFYMIDGIRFGFTGHADGPLVVGALVLTALNVALWTLAWHLVRIGYRLKT